jgi:hypothetical protein
MGWPELALEMDRDTFSVLHLAAQMLGKIRVAHSPWVNHGWHVALQPVATGFETLPTSDGDGRTFTLRLDLCNHEIVLLVSDGATAGVSLELPSIAQIHSNLVGMLDELRLPSDFHGIPNELPQALPFEKDEAPRKYNRNSADRLRQAFAAVLPVFERFRAGFCGKSSPVHLWWGSFDLAVSRFSGREAPLHPGGVPALPDRITREAYSHEVTSAGFWASGASEAEPFFYSYIYPEPGNYRTSAVTNGRFDETYGEFILPYSEVRASPHPERVLATFLQSAYEVAAAQAKWDRAALEREPIAP